MRKLTTIRRQIVRLEQLVEALLDVSRLMEGRLHLTPGGGRPGRAGHRHRGVAVGDGVARRLDDQPALRARRDRTLGPPAHRPGDHEPGLERDQVRARPARSTSTSTSTRNNGQRTARLRVRDAGIGIPPEQRKRIFDRFERAPAERHYPGLGLGLWIAKQIVDASSGTITVESEVGVGSTFTVRLPRSA